MPKATRETQGRLDQWVTSGRDAPPRTTRAARGQLSRGQHNELVDRGRLDTPQRRSLVEVAAETKQVLPEILDQIPSIRAGMNVAYSSDSLPALEASQCPKRTASGKAPIRVVNDDTFNAAMKLAAAHPGGGPVAVLNMASDIVPGGGWDHGAMAQEEELCFRSSLYLALPRRHYPWAPTQALYAPNVVIIREDFGAGHKLLTPETRPADLPVVGVLSVAALRAPRIKMGKMEMKVIDTKQKKPQQDGDEGEDGDGNQDGDGNGNGNGNGNGGGGGSSSSSSSKVINVQLFADPRAREQAKEKMRLTLRMAALNHHGLLVLGALGCGAFRNPKHDVAFCWLEVLREAEFQGGWWKEIWFAVFDRRREGNFELFESILGGEQV